MGSKDGCAALGAGVPFLVVWRYGAELPVPPHFGLAAGPIALAIAFGLLTAIAFAVPPLSWMGSILTMRPTVVEVGHVDKVSPLRR